METGERPKLTMWMAVMLLAASIAVVALYAECLAFSIDHLVTSLNISLVFVRLVLLPIMGNVSKYATAVTVAFKNNIALNLSVAVGSGMEIVLLVISYIVVRGWCLENDEMTLYVDVFQVIILFVSLLLVTSVIWPLLNPPVIYE